MASSPKGDGNHDQQRPNPKSEQLPLKQFPRALATFLGLAPQFGLLGDTHSARANCAVSRKSQSRFHAPYNARPTDATRNMIPNHRKHCDQPRNSLEAAKPRDAVVRASTVLLTKPSWVFVRCCHRTNRGFPSASIAGRAYSSRSSVTKPAAMQRRSHIG